MRLEITQADIDLGLQKYGRSCPIARSALRAFKGIHVRVGLTILRVWKDGDEKSAQYPLPDEAKDFIKIFDTLGKNYVKPFSFEI